MPKQIDLFSEPKKKKSVFIKEPEQLVSIDESIFAQKKSVKEILVIKKVEEHVSIDESIFSTKKTVVNKLNKQIDTKVKDFVDIGESIFAPKKVVVLSDISWRSYEESDEDKVSMDESIFAAPKKGCVTKLSDSAKMSEKEKVDYYNSLFTQYNKQYVINSKIFYDRKNIVTPDIFDRCCGILNKAMREEAISDIVLKSLVSMVKNVCLTPNEVLYRYTDAQSVMIRFVNDVIPDVDGVSLFSIIDKAYAEAFIERGGLWLR